MQVTVNGKTEEMPEDTTVSRYLERRGASPESLVVELNGAVLARTGWPGRILRDGDRLEIVRFVQGG
ncbi:MAG: sulfur carrier protein ThiS [Peptococcaceae bacterium]|jgi:sulfur carrier protein|nr:sulfur carrier protein ThiS [Peptococcaceae bacterium]